MFAFGQIQLDALGLKTWNHVASRSSMIEWMIRGSTKAQNAAASLSLALLVLSGKATKSTFWQTLAVARKVERGQALGTQQITTARAKPEKLAFCLGRIGSQIAIWLVFVAMSILEQGLANTTSR